VPSSKPDAPAGAPPLARRAAPAPPGRAEPALPPRFGRGMMRMPPGALGEESHDPTPPRFRVRDRGGVVAAAGAPLPPPPPAAARNGHREGPHPPQRPQGQAV